MSSAKPRKAPKPIRLAATLKTRVVLMDLQMPTMGGAEATHHILDLDPPPAVLVVTVQDTDADILPAIEAGAAGYLLKDTPPEQLLDAITAAARGETVLAPRVAMDFPRLCAQAHRRGKSTSRLVQRARTPRHRELTLRELEILGHVARGLSNRDIANAIVVTEATVKTHLVHIYDKLNVDSRTAAVATARELGYIPRN